MASKVGGIKPRPLRVGLDNIRHRAIGQARLCDGDALVDRPEDRAARDAGNSEPIAGPAPGRIHYLTVDHPGVIIRNCEAQYITVNAENCTIQDTTVTGQNTGSSGINLFTSGATVQRCDLAVSKMASGWRRMVV